MSDQHTDELFIPHEGSPTLTTEQVRAGLGMTRGDDAGVSR